jgi:hypothetical protein
MRIGLKALQEAGWVAWVGALALSLSVFIVTVRLAPYSDVSPLVAYLVAFGLIVACVFCVTIATPPKPGSSVAIAAIGAAGLFLVQRAGAPSASAPAVLLALLALGSGLGTWVGASIEQPGHLLFVALVSTVIDTFSVTHPDGPSAALLRQPESLALLALPWPMLGTRDVVPLLGVGDLVFTSLYWSAGQRHALPARRTAIALGSGFVLAALTVVLSERAIPVLPFLAACMLVAQPAARAPQGRDMRRGLWVMTALGFALAVWVLRRSF